MSTPNPFIVQNPNSPLTIDHLRQINDALTVLDVAQAQVDLATRAGIDVTAQQAQITQAKAQLRQIKQTYFPGQ